MIDTHMSGKHQYDGCQELMACLCFHVGVDLLFDVHAMQHTRLLCVFEFCTIWARLQAMMCCTSVYCFGSVHTIAYLLTPLVTAVCSTGAVNQTQGEDNTQHKTNIHTGQQGSIDPARTTAVDTGFSGQIQRGRGNSQVADRQTRRQISNMPDHIRSRSDTAAQEQSQSTKRVPGRILEVVRPRSMRR